MGKQAKGKLPSTRESLAKISESLAHIARMLGTGLYDGKGDCCLENIQHALYDIAEYGSGKAPEGAYAWRHPNGS